MDYCGSDPYLFSDDQDYRQEIESPNDMLVDSDEFLNDADNEKDDGDVAIIDPDETGPRANDCMCILCKPKMWGDLKLTSLPVEAMKEIVLPPLPEQPPILEDAYHTWNITDWASMSRKAHGPVFQCGGHPW